MYTIKLMTWRHPSPEGQPDYRGQQRWCVLDDGDVYDHHATLDVARKQMAHLEYLADSDDTCPHCGGLLK